MRGELLSWTAEKTNEKVKYLVPQGYNYSIELCKPADICALNFTLATDVFTDETLIVANLTHYDPDNAVKLKLFFWKGPYPPGATPNNYSEPFQEPTCSNECTATGIKTCSDITHFKTCGEYDSDTCLDLGTATACSTNQMCLDGGCVPAYPILSVSYTTPLKNFGTKPACATGYDTWYYYNMTIAETGGVTGTNFGSRVRMFNWSESGVPKSLVEALKTTMPTGMPSSISAEQTITVPNRWFCIKSPYTYNVTETFYSDSSGTNRVFNYTVINVN